MIPCLTQCQCGPVELQIPAEMARKTEKESQLINWCFEPCQSQRIASGRERERERERGGRERERERERESHNRDNILYSVLKKKKKT